MLFLFTNEGQYSSKMPFMEELTPIIYDLRMLLVKIKEFYLIFDDPDIFLISTKALLF